MTNKAPDPLGALLDAAVRSYADAEPLSGLEERILNRVRLVHSERHFQRGPLVAIGAALALAFSCLFVVSLHHTRIKPEPKREAVAVVHVPLKSHVAPTRVVRIKRRRPLRRLPKRDIFPTPQPPTAEELALLQFVKRDPKEAAQTFASLQRQMDTPLDIEPLEIKPLQMDESSN